MQTSLSNFSGGVRRENAMRLKKENPQLKW
jgi:hypothetical protein